MKHTSREAIEQAPEWRTLKGVETPFRIHTGGGEPLRRNHTPADETMTIVNTRCAGGVRRGTTADGREVMLWGTATKYWVTPGAPEQVTPPVDEADTVDTTDAQPGPAVHEFSSSREAYDATQCRDDIRDGDVVVIASAGIVGFLAKAWPVAITEAYGELHTLRVPAREYANGAYVASVELAEQIAGGLWAPIARGESPVVEGVVVEHAGTTEGSLPKHSTHPDVVAACAVLGTLKPATLTDHIDTSRYADDVDLDTSVRGYMVEPRGNGRVAAYWIEGGLHTLPDGAPHEVELEILRDKFERAGWSVEPKSLTCVFAWCPTTDEAPAPATYEENTQAANEALAGVDFDEPRCVHEFHPIDGVSRDPITTCARKLPTVSVGVFNDEGCIEAYDCAVQAANEAARLNAEEEAPKHDPLYTWHLMCPLHDEQTLDECEECNAIPAEDQCKQCQGKGCRSCYWTGETQDEADDPAEQNVTEAELAEAVEVVEDAERAEGTWRGGWIARKRADDDALFDIGPDAEQGELFE